MKLLKLLVAIVIVWLIAQVGLPGLRHSAGESFRNAMRRRYAQQSTQEDIWREQDAALMQFQDSVNQLQRGY